MTEKILIVEDEEKIARMVELELLHEGYEVEKAFDGRLGLDLLEKVPFDLVLLDVMLPGLSGMEVLRRLRRSSDLPVIMLTARDAIMDKVSALDGGADDYITKPFEIEELLARIRVCLRKQSTKKFPHRLLAFGELMMDTDQYEVTVKGIPVELTNREFELLKYLLENKGRVVTREILLDHVWGYDYAGETNAVDVYVRFLRGKIDETFDMKMIHTVRGVGYIIKEG